LLAIKNSKNSEAMKKNKFPKGWNEARVRRLLRHYEQQTEDEAVAEDEAVFEKTESV